MALSFPSSPTVGQYFDAGTRVWRWNGTFWAVITPLQFAQIGNYVEAIAPTPPGHQRLLSGPAPPIIIALLLCLSAMSAWAQATVSKVMIDVKMSDGTFQERQLTPVNDYYIGFSSAGVLEVKAGGSGSPGSGTVTSVGMTVPTGFSVTGSPITTNGTFGVTYAAGYQGYTAAEAAKLSGIAAGAEVNVNADWNAGSGDAQILNKPTLGTMAAETATNYLTTAAAASGYQSLDAQLTDIAGLAPTKGRLIVGDGTNWVDLGVGTNAHVLTADSAQPKGVKWAAVAGSGDALTSGTLDQFADVTQTGTLALTGTIAINGGTHSGTNTGDVTLAGVPDYITITGQIITLNPIDLVDNVSGALPITHGGTGETLKADAFDALAPTTTKGDLIVHDGSNNVRVPVPVDEGFVLTTDSAETAGVKWVSPTSAASSVTQVFTADGTWTKPAGAKYVSALIISGGGGGGGGRVTLIDPMAQAAAVGGGGGAPGCCVFIPCMNADALGATEPVAVGAGGLGGASAGPGAGTGGAGSNGGISTFGRSFIGGNNGNGGTTTTGAAGSALATSIGIYMQILANGVAGGAGSNGNAVTAPTLTNIGGPTGGGGGGGISTVGVSGTGGNGGPRSYTHSGTENGGNGGTLISRNGVIGNAGINSSGTGGGGGAAGDAAGTIDGGKGGDGGNYGAGGGGGGAARTGARSGAGGKGADGIVIITTYF